MHSFNEANKTTIKLITLKAKSVNVTQPDKTEFQWKAFGEFYPIYLEISKV